MGVVNSMTIDHVAMYVKDLEKARDFFVNYLDGKSNDGYHNKTTDFRSYFITFGDGARLELMTRPELAHSGKELLQTGYIHIAFQVGSKEKVDIKWSNHILISVLLLYGTMRIIFCSMIMDKLCQLSRITISEQEAKELMKCQNEKEIYDYMIENLGDRV